MLRFVRERVSPIRPSARRPVSVLCLLVYLVAWVGFPLPALPLAAAAGDGSEPFPCQDHHCGCASATQCWQNCCCMTLAERLAWARKQGVRPPSWVAKLETATASTTASRGGPSCCQPAVKTKTAACCATGDDRQGEQPAAACCASALRCCETRPPASAPACRGTNETANSAAKPATPKKSQRWLNFIAAQQCAGITMLWVANGAVVVPLLPVRAEPDRTVRPFCGAGAALCSSVSLLPEVPPPRA